MSDCCPPDTNPCNPQPPLLTTEQCQHALEAKFPNADVPLKVFPGMEPLISWLVFHEDTLRNAGLFPGCIPEMEPDPGEPS
jgi:hypothetical protein